MPDVESAAADHGMSPGRAPATLGNRELADNLEGTGAGSNKGGMPPEIRSTSYERFPEHMIGVLWI